MIGYTKEMEDGQIQLAEQVTDKLKLRATTINHQFLVFDYRS